MLRELRSAVINESLLIESILISRGLFLVTEFNNLGLSMQELFLLEV
ncbi:hypothetical protein HL033_02905 [Neoehrlichia mikurensis]|uniref:Uncharacterized protein n=1 Tax=Neoehrlichia mikurensis TaxID=89586 RepID=A0A9Q9BST4_9RICK|nr:hypothetical protein [Neoehrlichia mikurensis]QXK91700.1 hypothetical protein IAH97_02900 [Neoehrlichia mikurensis]QXK92911.1 hypothetical protein HUN61_02895 [Neoehrlichia mikurensis]QXK93391.1 hypothetical protein HL033_02905 [Neoehrlichia mikurensis]UTO55660.1 hypothetical protein LUA82_01050 [Neoehrlichia mikurensis]